MIDLIKRLMIRRYTGRLLDAYHKGLKEGDHATAFDAGWQSGYATGHAEHSSDWEAWTKKLDEVTEKANKLIEMRDDYIKTLEDKLPGAPADTSFPTLNYPKKA